MTDVPPTAISRQRAQCVERAMASAKCSRFLVQEELRRWFELPEWKRRLFSDVVLCGGDLEIWIEATRLARGD